MSRAILNSEKNLPVAPKYIIILSMIYVTAFIFPLILAYRMVSIGPFLLPGGTLFFPLSYFFGDMIAEVYGYQIARQLIWSAIFCQLIAALFIIFVLNLPYPNYWHSESAFNTVLGNSLRYAFASTIGNLFGEFFNIYFIARGKIYLRGKYFWARSMASSCIGEAALTLIVFFITFVGTTNINHVFDLMLSGYIFKVIYAGVAAFFGHYLVAHLKKSEGIDVYDYKTNFNPFRFKIDHEIFKEIKQTSE